MGGLDGSEKKKNHKLHLKDFSDELMINSDESCFNSNTPGMSNGV